MSKLSMDLPSFVDETVSGTFHSPRVFLRPCTAMSVIADWAGTLTGTLEFWVSNKKDPDATTDADWEQLTTVAFSASPGGSPGSGFTVDRGVAFTWGKVKLSGVSGSGNLTLDIALRGQGH